MAVGVGEQRVWCVASGGGAGEDREAAAAGRRGER